MEIRLLLCHQNQRRNDYFAKAPTQSWNRWWVPIKILITLQSGISQMLFSKKTKSWSIGLSPLVMVGKMPSLYKMSTASSTASTILQPRGPSLKAGNVPESTKAANVPSKPLTIWSWSKSFIITTIQQIEFIFADYEGIGLRENEILINRPFVQLNGGINIQDERGFQYRKAYGNVRIERNGITWKCQKSNSLGCKCRIKTRGNLVVVQRLEHNHDAYAWNTLILAAADNWNPEELVLRENEILINRPFIECIGVNGALNIQDEQGNRYRKTYGKGKGRTEKKGIDWRCQKSGTLGCRCRIKTRGDIIVVQRFEHNHDAYAWNTLILAAADNWDINELVLKEHEILINRPFYPCAAIGTAVNIQDEEGFRYRKTGRKADRKATENWKCLKKNHGCKCNIVIRDGMIILQRHQHNHGVQDYRPVKK